MNPVNPKAQCVGLTQKGIRCRGWAGFFCEKCGAALCSWHAVYRKAKLGGGQACAYCCPKEERHSVWDDYPKPKPAEASP